jgi:hypothetical protein
MSRARASLPAQAGASRAEVRCFFLFSTLRQHDYGR